MINEMIKVYRNTHDWNCFPLAMLISQLEHYTTYRLPVSKINRIDCPIISHPVLYGAKYVEIV